MSSTQLINETNPVASVNLPIEPKPANALFSHWFLLDTTGLPYDGS